MSTRKVYSMRSLRQNVEDEIAFREQKAIDERKTIADIVTLFNSSKKAMALHRVWQYASDAATSAKVMNSDKFGDYGFAPNYINDTNMLSIMYKIPFIHPGILCNSHFVELASQINALSHIAQADADNNKARGIAKLIREAPYQFSFFLIDSICEKMLDENRVRKLMPDTIIISARERLEIDPKRKSRYPFKPQGNAPSRRRYERKAFYDYLEIIMSCPDCCHRALNADISNCDAVSSFGDMQIVNTRGVYETEVTIRLEDTSNLVTYLCRDSYAGLENLFHAQMQFIQNAVLKRNDDLLNMMRTVKSTSSEEVHRDIAGGISRSAHDAALFVSEILYNGLTKHLDDLYDQGFVFRYSPNYKLSSKLMDAGETKGVVVPESFSGKTFPSPVDGAIQPIIRSGILYVLGVSNLLVLIAERNLGFQFGWDFRKNDVKNDSSVFIVYRRNSYNVDRFLYPDNMGYINARKMYCIMSAKMCFSETLQNAIKYGHSLLDTHERYGKKEALHYIRTDMKLLADTHALSERIMRHYEKYGDLP